MASRAGVLGVAWDFSFRSAGRLWQTRAVRSSPDPAVPPSPSAPSAPPSPSAPPAPPSPPSPSAPSGPPVPLVGRERESAALAALLRAEPLVGVVGPLGIGKTALVRSVLAQSSAEGFPPPAYASIGGAASVRELLERTGRALGRERPVLESSRVLQALRALVRDARCTLVWDDAQNAAEGPLASALEVLRGALEPSGGARVVVIARELPRSLRLPLFELGPLDAAAAGALLTALEAERGRSLREELIARSGGNPLALCLALAGGPLDALQGIRAATSSLPAHAREILALLAASETPLQAEELEARHAAGLQTLLESSLAVREGDQIALPAGRAQAVRAVLGAPSPQTWDGLARLSTRALARAPEDPDALLLACRTRTHGGDAWGALRLLRAHARARDKAPSAALERLLGEMAAADPRCDDECRLALAREQLRWGDFEEARRTLDRLFALSLAPREGGAAREPAVLLVELPPLIAQRARVLRAETLVRAGEPLAAAQELEQARAGATGRALCAVELGLAELAILRGELTRARRALLALQTGASPGAEGRRATLLALSYLVEDRHAQALGWVRRARRAFARREASPDPLLSIVEVGALLGLDLIDRAQAIAQKSATPNAGPGPAALFHAGVLFRRGELSAALEVAAPAYRALDRRADRVFRAVVAHDSARSALALGRFAAAEEFLRTLSGIAAEPGLAVLRPTCDLDFALLHEARGDRAAARERVQTALEGPCRSPVLRIEAWSLGALPERPVVSHPSLSALLHLRGAERALEEGRLEEALQEAARAEGFYARAGAGYEAARAQLARKEALARLGLADDRPAMISSPPLQIAAHLVAAYAADRSGDLRGYQAALRAALLLAQGELRDPALVRACARAFLAAPGEVAPSSPFGALVARLRLDRPAALLAEAGERSWLLEENELPREPFTLTVTVDPGEARTSSGAVELPPQRVQLLACLVRAAERGASLEELHRTVWGAAEWHPLRNRNTVYVALTRLRETLGKLGLTDVLRETPEGRYRLVPPSVVVCRAPKVAEALANAHGVNAPRQTK